MPTLLEEGVEDVKRALEFNRTQAVGYGKPERRDIACESCGAMRYGVKCTPTTQGGKVLSWSYEKHCKACHHDARARHYDQLAANHRQQAREERTRQTVSRIKREVAADKRKEREDAR